MEDEIRCFINKCLYNLEYCCYKRPDNITPSSDSHINNCAEFMAGANEWIQKQS